MTNFLPNELRQINGGNIFSFCGLENIIIDIRPIGNPPPIPPISENPLIPYKKTTNRFGGISNTI